MFFQYLEYLWKKLHISSYIHIIQLVNVIWFKWLQYLNGFNIKSCFVILLTVDCRITNWEDFFQENTWEKSRTYCLHWLQMMTRCYLVAITISSCECFKLTNLSQYIGKVISCDMLIESLQGIILKLILSSSQFFQNQEPKNETWTIFAIV